MKIVALVGSLRKDSYNKQLALTIQERFTATFDLEVLDLGVLPHYNQDEEINPAESIVEFKRKVKEALFMKSCSELLENNKPSFEIKIFKFEKRTE